MKNIFAGPVAIPIRMLRPTWRFRVPDRYAHRLAEEGGGGGKEEEGMGEEGAEKEVEEEVKNDGDEEGIRRGQHAGGDGRET